MHFRLPLFPMKLLLRLVFRLAVLEAAFQDLESLTGEARFAVPIRGGKRRLFSPN